MDREQKLAAITAASTIVIKIFEEIDKEPEGIHYEIIRQINRMLGDIASSEPVKFDWKHESKLSLK